MHVILNTHTQPSAGRGDGSSGAWFSGGGILLSFEEGCHLSESRALSSLACMEFGDGRARTSARPQQSAENAFSVEGGM